MQISAFTRQETLALTECTSSRLSYLEKVDLIVLQRMGKNARPSVMFTWDQLLAIKVIKPLREEIPLSTVREIVRSFNGNWAFSLLEKQLFVLNDRVFWVNQDWSDLPEWLRFVSNNQTGLHTLFICPCLVNVVKEIWDAAEASPIVDFESFKCRAVYQRPDSKHLLTGETGL